LTDGRAFGDLINHKSQKFQAQHVLLTEHMFKRLLSREEKVAILKNSVIKMGSVIINGPKQKMAGYIIGFMELPLQNISRSDLVSLGVKSKAGLLKILDNSSESLHRNPIIYILSLSLLKFPTKIEGKGDNRSMVK
jgi:hypothetical protein